MSIAQTATADLARQLDAAPWGGKRPLVDDAARRLGVSANTLYASIRRFRGRSRKPRADRGALRTVDPAAIQAVAEIKTKCSDNLNGRTLPTDVAIQMAEANGAITPGAIARGSYDRHARRLRINKAAPARLYSRYQAARSNQIHQVDSSGSKYLRVLEQVENGDWLIGVKPPKVTRKRSVEPLGVWATAVIDDHSRVAFIIYDVAAGESARMVADALTRAWSGDPRCALQGMPASVQADHGPLRRSQEGRNFLDALGIELALRMPKSAWVGGKVERPWRTFFARFELPFLAKPDETILLSELNRRVFSYVRERNEGRHPWTPRKSRLQMYEEGLDRSTIAYVPEDAADAMWRDDRRRVGLDGTVRYKNGWYIVSDEIAGCWVRVVKGRDGSLLVDHDGKTWSVKEYKPHDAGEYRAHHYTPRQWVEKDAVKREISILPHAGEDMSFHLHTGPTQEPETPFNREEERVFVNREEAMAALGHWLGTPVHQLAPEIQTALRALLSKSEALRESVLMEFTMELRAQLA